jgi:mannose-6-phosphate isomerase
VEVLEGVIQRYAWGSPSAIPALLGAQPDGGPQAELWLGAHPAAPARAGGRPLDEVVAGDPVGALGVATAGRFGGRLPFLLKVLAAAEPLSLQAHPSTERAGVGFAEEEAAGIPLDVPERRYRDPHHKPELLCALTPFVALCGFRGLDATTALLDRLGLADEPVFSELGSGDLRATVGRLLSLPEGERAGVARTIADAASRDESPEAVWGRRIAEKHPGDPGIGVALLLNLVELQAGEAIFLPAGNLHAYLEGVGVEIMASSDNVLRGGLTPKHVDVDELLAVLDVQPGPPPLVHPLTEGRIRRYLTPIEDFELALVDLGDDPAEIAGDRPRVVLCLEGEACLRAGGGELRLEKGQAAWVPAADGPLTLTGTGLAAVATTP